MSFKHPVALAVLLTLWTPASACGKALLKPLPSPTVETAVEDDGREGSTGRAAGVPAARSVRVSSPEGDSQQPVRQPGEYLWLGEFPYLYQGEPVLTWEVHDRVLYVNGKEAGLDLSGLDVDSAVALVTQHQTIQTVLCERATALPEPLMAALSATPGSRLALSLGDYRGSSKDLAHVASRLAGKVVYLSLTGANVDSGVMPHLASLTRLRELDLTGTQVSDAGLAHLARLTNLQKLNLWGTDVSDGGLAHLAQMTNLQKLNLWGTDVSDGGLAHLARLTNLRKLDLTGTQVSDAGLGHLAQLTNLRERPDRDEDEDASEDPAQLLLACSRTTAAIHRAPKPIASPRRRSRRDQHLCVRSEAGFDLHAEVRILSHDRGALERLCRYMARPPIATAHRRRQARQARGARGRASPEACLERGRACARLRAGPPDRPSRGPHSPTVSACQEVLRGLRCAPPAPRPRRPEAAPSKP